MSGWGFRKKVALSFGLFQLLTLFVFAVLFVVFYLFASLGEVKKNLNLEAEELIRTHLVMDGGNLMFQKSSEGRTISVFLRDENLSALIFDSSLNRIGTYGIYRTLDENGGLSKEISEPTLKNVVDSGRVSYEGKRLFDGQFYMIVNYPIVIDGKNVGVLVVSKEDTLVDDVTRLVIVLVLVLVPGLFLVSWILFGLILNRLFKPLSRMAKVMKKSDILEKGELMTAEGEPDDELVVLANTYNQMNERIHEGIRKQKEFITNASHELKTPIAEAVSSLEVLGYKLKNGKSKEKLNQIKHGLLSLSGVLNELLVVARIAADEEGEELDMAEEIKKVVDKQKEVLKKRLDVKIMIGSGRVVARKKQLEILLNNLITNAEKYSVEDTNIVVTLGKDKNGLVLKVINNIEKSMGVKRLVERFYRGHGVSQKEGHGIGLSIVKEICDMNGWKLKMQSEGESFVVCVFGIDLL